MPNAINAALSVNEPSWGDIARRCHGAMHAKEDQPSLGDAETICAGREKDDLGMIGHYIEDDALDALALMAMINGEGGISLTTSTSLNDFEDWIGGSDLDFVLVDIYRPDSRSFEDEVQRIRAHSNAPIFFITGDEAKFYVDDALEVGAEGVLEKEALTADGLLEILVAAIRARPAQLPPSRAKVTEVGVEPTGVFEGGGIAPEESATDPSDWLILPPDPDRDPDPAGIVADRFDLAQGYLHEALRAAAECNGDAHALSDILDALADAQLLLKAYAQDRLGSSTPSPRPVPRIIRDLQRVALSMAKQRGVKLVFQTTASVFDEVAMSEVSTCIRSLLKSVIIGSPKGETIKFNGLSNANGVRLSITSTAPLPFDVGDVLGQNLPDEIENLASTILMTATCLLLGLDYSKITVFMRGSLHTILIDIQDS